MLITILKIIFYKLFGLKFFMFLSGLVKCQTGFYNHLSFMNYHLLIISLSFINHLFINRLSSFPQYHLYIRLLIFASD